MMILGYDLRLKRHEYFDTWSLENTAFSFSLGSWPLSVDTLIWPSLFYSKEELSGEYSSLNIEMCAKGLPVDMDIDGVSYNNEVNGLWSSWKAMLDYAKKSGKNYEKSSSFIFFEVEESFNLSSSWYLERDLISPPANSEKRVLGYEVCDSTLSSCHFLLFDNSTTYQENRNNLNSHYLFDSASLARLFLDKVIDLEPDKFIAPSILKLTSLSYPFNNY